MKSVRRLVLALTLSALAFGGISWATPSEARAQGYGASHHSRFTPGYGGALRMHGGGQHYAPRISPRFPVHADYGYPPNSHQWTPYRAVQPFGHYDLAPGVGSGHVDSFHEGILYAAPYVHR